MPKKPLQWEVYRPIKGSPGAFIGIVEAPDETSALKAAIEEFGIVNPEYQQRLFVRRDRRRWLDEIGLGFWVAPLFAPGIKIAWAIPIQS